MPILLRQWKSFNIYRDKNRMESFDWWIKLQSLPSCTLLLVLTSVKPMKGGAWLSKFLFEPEVERGQKHQPHFRLVCVVDRGEVLKFATYPAHETVHCTQYVPVPKTFKVKNLLWSFFCLILVFIISYEHNRKYFHKPISKISIFTKKGKKILVDSGKSEEPLYIILKVKHLVTSIKISL